MQRTIKGFHLLRALEVFEAVSETGSMTAAARMLRISQPAISQQIRHLEAVLSVSLVDRSLRPLKLTQAGHMTREYAARLLLDAEQFLAGMHESGVMPLSHLRISVPGSLCARLVPPIVLALKERVAMRNVSVWSGLVSEQRAALLNREVDIIITSNALYDVDGLDRHRLFREPFILLLPGSRRDASPSLRQLLGTMPFVRYAIRSDIGLQIENHLRRLQLHVPKWAEFDAPESVVATVAAGDGWAITTPLHLEYGMRPGYELYATPLPRPGMMRTTHLVARSGELDSVVATVVRICLEVLKRAIVPDLTAALPWIGSQVVIGGR